jgi:hypothetical protein
MFFRFPHCTAGSIFAGHHLLTKAVNFFFQPRRGVYRFFRRDKWAGLKIRLLAVGPVKPNAKLASEFQRRQRIRVVTCGLMSRPVTSFAQGWKTSAASLGTMRS